MEERVGEIWHNFITRMADKNYPDAEVELINIKKTIGIFFAHWVETAHSAWHKQMRVNTPQSVVF